MNKEFFKFLINLLAFILIIWLIICIIVKIFPMYVFDGEYATYKQTIDYIHNTIIYQLQVVQQLKGIIYYKNI